MSDATPRSVCPAAVLEFSLVGRQATKVEIGQPKLRFVRCRDPDRMLGSSRVLAEETLVLLNNTAQRHAFKIRTTARDRYRVEPSCGLLDCGTKFAVKISMVLERGATSDKFQVLTLSPQPSPSTLSPQPGTRNPKGIPGADDTARLQRLCAACT
jgi:hypothetical protein